jgi:DNA repair protein RecO (recombination protein O)
MVEWDDSGIILSLRPHGETGAIATLLTAEHGRAPGYVYGAVSGRVRGILETGNVVSAHWQAKTPGQLGTYTLELEKSFAADVMSDPLRLTALQSAAALADKTLPEGEPYPGVFEGMKALLGSFRGDMWPAAYILWEIGLLRELGFGLDLSKCASTGDADDLIYVSPKSGRAVSRAAGEIYKEKLLPLPPFLRGTPRMETADIVDGLKLTGHFLLHRVFGAAHANLPDARLRLEEKFVKSL